MYKCRPFSFPCSAIGFFFLMFLLFGIVKFAFLPLFFVAFFMFLSSRHKSRWQHSRWDNEWEKPKRKNDDLDDSYEKPKRHGESEIYYF